MDDQENQKISKITPGETQIVPGGPKSVPGVSRISLWGSKIGPWGLQNRSLGVPGGSWRASRGLQGVWKVPRALQGDPRGAFWGHSEAIWG